MREKKRYECRLVREKRYEGRVVREKRGMRVEW